MIGLSSSRTGGGALSLGLSQAESKAKMVIIGSSRFIFSSRLLNKRQFRVGGVPIFKFRGIPLVNFPRVYLPSPSQHVLVALVAVIEVQYDAFSLHSRSKQSAHI